jgi:hypothetical protein
MMVWEYEKKEDVRRGRLLDGGLRVTAWALCREKVVGNQAIV